MSEIRRLDGLDTLEVSLVPRGANKRRFAIKKAEWDAAYVNDLPDSAFLFIEGGGEKDDDGKTKPRTLRHFPVRNSAGDVDAAHVRNAIARIPQSSARGLSSADKSKLQDKARKLLTEVSKSAEENPVDEIIKAVLDTDIENEAQLDKVLKTAKYSEKATLAFKSMYRIAAGFKDEMPKGMVKQLADLCGYEAPEAVVRKADEQLDLNAIPEAMRGQVEALWKANRDGTERAAKLEATLKAERDERVTKEYVAKAAAEFGALPSTKPEELGPVLKALHDAAPEHAAKLEGVLKAASEAIKQGELLRSVGRPAGGAEAGSAWTEIEKLATGLVQKSAEPMAHATAIDEVLKGAEGKRLYAQYLAEHPRQTGGNR